VPWVPGQHLGLLADPVVVHALGVFGVSHQPADVHPAIYLKFVANHADNGDVFTRPIAFFQHLKTVGFAPFDRRTSTSRVFMGFKPIISACFASGEPAIAVMPPWYWFSFLAYA
jgi:hypothetical protein